jgi:hypothetical protein
LVDVSSDISFSLIYRLLNSRPEAMDALVELVRKMDKNSVIVGDINLPGIDWERGTATGRRSMQFLEACEDAGLEQLVTFQTQVRGNILDLLLTNIPDRVSDVKGIGRLGKSDHTMVSSNVLIIRKCVQTTEMLPNWHKANWSAIRTGLSDIDWKEELGILDADEAWVKFTSVLEGLVEQNVPMKPRRIPHKPVWMTWEVTRAIRKKRRLWKRAKCGQEEMAKYRKAEKDATKMIRNAKRNFEKKLERENHGNSRPFYAYVKGKTKSRSTVGRLKDSQNVIVAGDEAIANILNDYLTSVFTEEEDGQIPEEEGT